jgi:hypothetical protein
MGTALRLVSVLVASAAAAAAFPMQPSVPPGDVPRGRPATLSDLTAADLALASSGCGIDRWDVKTGSDADRYKVRYNSPVATSIYALRGRSTPASLPAHNRVATTETSVFVISGTLTQYRVEGDSDIHAVVKDASGRSMIVELPAPACVAHTQPFKTQITSARQAFVTRNPASTTWRYVRRAIKVRGIGFWDNPNGVGAAPNGIELHPVLGVSFP